MLEQSIIYNEICEYFRSGPAGIVIFGASGDLTKRKLIPALFRLYKEGCLSKNFYVVGFARSNLNDSEFRTSILETLMKNLPEESESEIKSFTKQCFYFSGQYDSIESYEKLKREIEALDRKFSTDSNIIFNLAVPPILYTEIIEKLSQSKLLKKNQNTNPFNRVIIEKPFGYDFDSAVKMHNKLNKFTSDKQIYRIDHYLGKDTVQNIFVFRFANSIFEPIWNRENIDHVQITVAEDIGIGSRAGYFDKAGLIKDMLQNHLLQLLCYIAMEPPANMIEDSIRDEKTKVLKCIRTCKRENVDNCYVLGQYTSGTVNGEKVLSYKEEKGVSPDSSTETYFASKMFIDNWRWEGVPFYLRCGKRLAKKQSRISVVFKKAPTSVFGHLGVSDKFYNIITFDIFPQQGVSLRFQAKLPDSKTCIGSLNMSFNYKTHLGKELTADYDTLILDCLLGDQSLFWRKDAVEISWKILAPVLDKLQSKTEKENIVHEYKAGTWGPAEADDFIQKDNRFWIN